MTDISGLVNETGLNEKQAEETEKNFETAEKEAQYNTGASSDSSSSADVPKVPSPHNDVPKSENIEVNEKESKKGRRWKKSKKSKEAAAEPEQDPLGHLPAHEKEILNRQLVVPPVPVTYTTLFRYATKYDILIMIVGAICAIAGGAINPLMTVVFGNLTGVFQGFFLGQYTRGYFNHELSHYTLYFVYIGIAEFVVTYVATVAFIYTGEHLTRKIRERYLAAILRQNIGFFDKLGAGEITTRITADTNLIQDALSQKIALILTGLSTFVTAFVIGFIEDWRLTLILSSVVFAIVFTMGFFSRWIVKWNKSALDSYAQGGTVAEEVLSSIRNATAFSTQDKLAKQYDSYLNNAEYYGVRHKGLLGCMIGLMMFIVYSNYALAFWQGSRYLVAGTDGVTLNKIVTILLAIMIGAFQLGNVAPHMQAITTGTAAGGKIFSTIDRVSPLDPEKDDGLKPENVQGVIELKNVKHIYPSRPEVVVMEDVSLVVPAGKTTALVGASGSGKSTIVGLVERFYDPVGGQVLLDGIDVRDINLHYLRQNISLVSQEPTLFGTTIRGNIAHGLIGTPHEQKSEQEKETMIIEAAKMANAHDFISALPEGYETNVGEKGFLLSGGQKQRIAIARAVVSDPTILLLDEATSALDTKSEGVVQAALDKAAEGRTTIVIAHRLSTIRNSHNIVVMSAGRIVEQGTHSSLLEKRGTYHGLVEAQQIAAANKNQDVDTVEIADDQDEQKRQPDERIQLTRTTTGKSISSQVLKNRPAKKDANYSLWTLIKVIASFNKKEAGIMFMGLIASIIAGGGQPVNSIFFAKCIVSMSLPPAQYGELRSQINFWSGMFFMLAWVQLIAYSVQGIAFAYCSERLIHRARNESFRAMLRQDIGWYDYEENSAGALTSFLSTETTNAAGLSGTTLGTLLNVITTLITAFVVSLIIGPKLAAVCISLVPVLLGCGFFRFYILARFDARSKKVYEKSASYACEATSAIRTVASLTREHDVWDHYHDQLVAQGGASLRSVMKSSTLYAASQSFIFFCIALGFWYGGTLIASRQYDEQQFFICFSLVIFGSQSAGTIFSFAPDMGKARSATARLKTLFDRIPSIDIWSDAGIRLPTGHSSEASSDDSIPTVRGELTFENVHFRYPTRAEQPVLRGLDLHIKPGQYVALVGASGCGKSTTIGLLERFYDPLSGTVKLDGVDIATLNLADYRSHLALVSQEPTLYQGTIRENILLGADHSEDIAEDVMDREIEKACRDANIYDFVMSLPEGFATKVGNKGVMLSGGQKQRIAIARALLRKPKVLLLDEATSALDSESEKVVQAALDVAAKGRTTIAVAHRLSTVQKADVIFVFESGRIVEKGTHAELMARKGIYHELAAMQQLTAPV